MTYCNRNIHQQFTTYISTRSSSASSLCVELLVPTQTGWGRAMLQKHFRQLLLLSGMFLTSFSFAAELAGGSSLPPKLVVEDGACPFECCTYGEWVALAPVQLLDAPDRWAKPVARVDAFATVIAETGKVVTVPGRVIVNEEVRRGNTISYSKGDILYVYTYYGEGHFKVWHNGNYAVQYIDDPYPSHKKEAWSTWIIRPETEWWVKIRTENGESGWAGNTRDFEGLDSCS